MDAQQAQDKVRDLVLSGSDSASSRLETTPFEHGWLILVIDGSGVRRGSLAYTVDRTDGAVRSFPSTIPAMRILEEYLDLKEYRPVLA